MAMVEPSPSPAGGQDRYVDVVGKAENGGALNQGKPQAIGGLVEQLGPGRFRSDGEESVPQPVGGDAEDRAFGIGFGARGRSIRCDQVLVGRRLALQAREVDRYAVLLGRRVGPGAKLPAVPAGRTQQDHRQNGGCKAFDHIGSPVLKAAYLYAGWAGRVIGKHRNSQAVFDGRGADRALPFSAEWPICTV